MIFCSIWTRRYFEKYEPNHKIAMNEKCLELIVYYLASHFKKDCCGILYVYYAPSICFYDPSILR